MYSLCKLIPTCFCNLGVHAPPPIAFLPLNHHLASHVLNPVYLPVCMHVRPSADDTVRPSSRVPTLGFVDPPFSLRLPACASFMCTVDRTTADRISVESSTNDLLRIINDTLNNTNAFTTTSFKILPISFCFQNLLEMEKTRNCFKKKNKETSKLFSENIL